MQININTVSAILIFFKLTGMLVLLLTFFFILFLVRIWISYVRWLHSTG